MYTYWPWLVLCLWLYLQESLFQSTQYLHHHQTQVNKKFLPRVNYSKQHIATNLINIHRYYSNNIV